MNSITAKIAELKKYIYEIESAISIAYSKGNDKKVRNLKDEIHEIYREIDALNDMNEKQDNEIIVSYDDDLVVVTTKKSDKEVAFKREHFNEAHRIYNVNTMLDILGDVDARNGISRMYEEVAAHYVAQDAIKAARPERNKEIANEIIGQLGGAWRLSVMIGAYNFFAIDNGLQFQFKAGRKANKIRIELTAWDDYTVTLYKGRGINTKEVASISGIYCDQLKSWFEEKTGLYLSL